MTFALLLHVVVAVGPCAPATVDRIIAEYQRRAEAPPPPSPVPAPAPFRPAVDKPLLNQCRAGDQAACGSLGALLQLDPLEACALAGLKEACAAGAGVACLDGAILINAWPHAPQEERANVPALRQRAGALLKQSCRAGKGDACRDLLIRGAAMWLVTDDHEKQELEERGCDAGEGELCAARAGIVSGDPGERSPDEAQAPALLEKGCFAAHPSAVACNGLAARDRRRANALRNRACDLDLTRCALPGQQRGARCGDGRIETVTSTRCPPCRPGLPCRCSPVETPLEECDGSILPQTCTDLGYAGGAIRCNSVCKLDVSGCRRSEPGRRPTTFTLGRIADTVFAGGREPLGLLDVNEEGLRVWWLRGGKGEPTPTIDSHLERTGRLEFERGVIGWVGRSLVAAAYQNQLGTSVFASPRPGRLEGPITTLSEPEQRPVFLAPAVNGAVALLGLSHVAPRRNEHGATIFPVSLQVALVEPDGKLRAGPRDASSGEPYRAVGASRAVGVPGGFLVAAPGVPSGPNALIDFAHVSLSGEVSPGGQVHGQPTSSALVRLGNGAAYVFTDDEGTYLVQLDARAHPGGPARKLAPFEGLILDADAQGRTVRMLVQRRSQVLLLEVPLSGWALRTSVVLSQPMGIQAGTLTPHAAYVSFRPAGGLAPVKVARVPLR